VIALRTLLFTVVVPGTVAVYVPWWILARSGELAIERRGIAQLAGLALALFGGAIYARCAWDFTFVGRGTPAPIDPPRELVASGLYRWTRNPMYVGVGSVLLGEALLFGSARLLGYALAVLTAFHLFVVLYEEPTLRRSFGAAYERYCERVPRWIGRVRPG
jgi:protein-S-isoprenylcysteine O-methyltransferase Ste14